MKNVALIAVHGVADQVPCATAREIADLLVRTDPEAGPFYERGVRLEVENVVVPEFSGKQLWQQPADFTFMYGQLTGDIKCTGTDRVKPPDPTKYDTLCLSRTGSRTGRAVHVYEMYWADLSRLGTSFTRVFGEFYQILFHVSSLGRHTVDEARDNPYNAAERGALSALSRAQAAAATVLTLPIPILNLVLLTLVAGVIALWLPVDQQRAVGAIGLATLVAAVVGTTCYRYARHMHFAVPFALAAIPAIGVYLVLRAVDTAERISLAYVVLCYLAVSVGFLAIARAYDRNRPGAFKWGIALWIVATALLVYFVRQASDGQTVNATFALLRTVEAVYLILTVFWTVIFFFHWWIALRGFGLNHRARSNYKRAPENDKPEALIRRRRTQRVVWTGRIAVIVPTALFLVATLALWAAAAVFAGKLRPTLSGNDLYVPGIEAVYQFDEAAIKCGKDHPDLGRHCYTTFSDWGLDLVASAASPMAAYAVFFMCLALVLALWAFLPCVLAEIKPPASASDGSLRGDWLDAGFKLLRWAGWCLFIAVVIALPLGALMRIAESLHVPGAGQLLALLDPRNFGLWSAREIVLGAGGALAGTAVAFVAFRGRLSKVAKQMRPALDVALDVDNHLREHPLAANSRAKIAARFASLLRHVCTSGAPNGEPFDALVIVAHSQGTVITADLLRFLQKASALNGKPADTRLERIDATAPPASGAPPAGASALPVYLLTVGCPLRQLYGLRFPDLYEWARHTEQGPWNAPPASHVITHGPKPSELNVRSWVNAYRSGDYVGRYLWRPEDCDYRWTSAARSQSNPPDRVEFCIGDGAHTHYFDSTVDTIGKELDELIKNA